MTVNLSVMTQSKHHHVWRHVTQPWNPILHHEDKCDQNLYIYIFKQHIKKIDRHGYVKTHMSYKKNSCTCRILYSFKKNTCQL